MNKEPTRSTVPFTITSTSTSTSTSISPLSPPSTSVFCAGRSSRGLPLSFPSPPSSVASSTLILILRVAQTPKLRLADRLSRLCVGHAKSPAVKRTPFTLSAFGGPCDLLDKWTKSYISLVSIESAALRDAVARRHPELTVLYGNASNVLVPGKIDSIRLLEVVKPGGLRVKANGAEVEDLPVARQSAGEMPGILKRTHDRVDADNLDSTAEEPARKRQTLDNADLGIHVNGAASDDATFSGNGIVLDSKLASTVEELVKEQPPEIFHITGTYVPLSTLIARTAQLTLNDLEQLINELADIQLNQVNGYGSSHSTQIMIRKKELFFEFAQNYRNKFIKLLVISQWSRQSESVSKLIDLNHWMMLQRELYRNATAWMGELRRLLSGSKIPPPDLKLALDVLSTGKAEWISHLGYIPPEPFSPKQLLKALRTINTLLTIRLNLHETIPSHMMDFSIDSGRVTFRVKDEFELDLSIADEDPSSQLYFIDFRFHFSPCMTELPEGPLRNHIEGKTNDVLRSEGLTGCYEFLHGLVLTHKLTILRQQAFSLARSRWTENIKVEPVHRSLIIQYWINRPGQKNWIEIGIKRKRANGAGRMKSETPCISLRWHRHGKEVLNHDVEVNAADLSIEVILKDIIAKHTNYIFKETKRRLKESSVYAKRILLVKHKAHPTEPAECVLKLQTNHSATITIILEPISGSFAISPTTGSHYRTERELNRLRDPADEASNILALLRCNSTLEQVHSRIRGRRWHILQTFRPNQETVKRLFGSNMIRYAFYRNPAWEKAWILALTTSLEGDHWWIIELRDAPQNPTPMDFASEAYQPMRRSLRVVLKHDQTLVFEPSYQALAAVERSAAALLSRFIDARELTGMKMEYKQQPPIKALAKHEVPDLFIHYPQNTTSANATKPWCRDIIKSTFTGLSGSRTHTSTVITGHLRRRIPDLKRLAANMDSALAFNPTNGEFAFRLQTAIGTPSVSELKRRLERVACLVRFIHVIGQNKVACTQISLSRITFSYGALTPLPLDGDSALIQPPLTATVVFLPDEPMRLAFEPGNPHIRIADFLNRELNGPVGLVHVLSLLSKTLNLLRAFATNELLHHDGVSLQIFPRSATSFRVRYAGRDTLIAFEASMRQRADNGVVWISNMACSVRKPSVFALEQKNATTAGNSKSSPSVTKLMTKPGKPTDTTSADPPFQPLETKLKPITTAWSRLTTERGLDWCGLGSGVMAQAQGVAACFAHVDEVLVQALAEADSISIEDNGATPNGVGGSGLAHATANTATTTPSGGGSGKTGTIAAGSVGAVSGPRPGPLSKATTGGNNATGSKAGGSNSATGAIGTLGAGGGPNVAAKARSSGQGTGQLQGHHNAAQAQAQAQATKKGLGRQVVVLD